MVKNEDVIKCFLYNKNNKTKNLESKNGELLLYNEIIAIKHNQFFSIICPLISRTTLRILNMLPNVKLNFRKGELILCNVKWSGEEKLIEPTDDPNDNENILW